MRDTIVLFEPARPRLKPGFLCRLQIHHQEITIVCARLATLKTSLVLRRLGTLTQGDFQGFAAGLLNVLDGNSQPKGSSTIT